MSRAREIADLVGGTTPDIILKTSDGAILNLQTSDTTVTANSILGEINFQAPDEASGTDAILVASKIEAVAEGTFSASSNATSLVFTTANSAAAGTASGKMTFTSGGELILKDTDTADGSSPTITLQSGDTDIAADDVLGSINFQAPDEGAGTDAILVAAGMSAISEGDFSSSNNATSLKFVTGNSAAAGSDGGSLILGSTGNLTLKDLRTADGSSPTITLQSGDTDIAADDVLGTINFQAPDEGAGTDAILVAAGIAAISEGDFSSSVNTTSLVFKTGASAAAAEKVRIDSAGRLLIGTTTEGQNQADNLTVSDSGNMGMTLRSTDSGECSIFFSDGTSGTAEYAGSVQYIHSDNSLRMATNAAERIRITSDGAMFFCTDFNSTTAGVRLEVDGDSYFTADGSNGRVIYANRLGSNGNLLEFARQGSTKGALQIDGSHFGIGSVATGIYFYDGISAVIPAGTSDNFLNGKDNGLDLGGSSFRWDDVFATNGTIQTSDENEKQNIASLTSAEITAATAISKLFKTFKWKDKVAAKGDNARTHTGVVAQQVQSAMSDAGLDAGNYAFFISTTWWETQTEVAAVEANEEKRIEAKDAYTRTDTYHTKDEAPEGATERNRKGIRYPELLAFVGEATEQRLTSIESRLTALEDA